MTRSLSPIGRAALAVGSALISFRNPRRADLIAILGDVTSDPLLPYLTSRIHSTEEGRQMLATLTPMRFPEDGSSALISLRNLPQGSLGFEYARFMDRRNFNPEDRNEVRFIDDPTHRWVLQRYRDVHDLWHVLTGMPTSLLGELAQKWFEAVQTGLPVAMLSAAVGPLSLSTDRRQVLINQLIPWAIKCGRESHDLLAIRYEDYLHRDLDELRKLWNITVPDIKVKGK